MSLPPSLPIQDIVQVNVSVASGGVAAQTFNQGLIIGNSTVIPTSGANPRVRQYPTLAAMLTDGFTNMEPEFLAAELYFGQVPAPSEVWIGRQDTGAGETLLQAVEACIAVAGIGKWYPFMGCNPSDADNLALAAYSNANWQTTFYIGWSGDAGIPAGTPNNIALQMQALNYKALLTYNTTQGSLYPNNIYAAAAVMGLACGLNTGAPASAFTLNLKKLSGIAPEPLTQTQYAAIVAANCNTCASFGAYLDYFVSGVQGNGEFYDQTLDRAMLVNLIQTNLMNLLTSVPKIPQTDAGEQQLIAQVNAACASLVTIGFLAPGVWEGVPITVGNTTIATGQSLPEGYTSLAPSFATISAGNRAARQAMPITTLVLEAGAVHSVVVNVNVQL